MKTEKEIKEIQANASKIKKFFKIEITISIFGKVLFHWVYPPQED